jgi:sigma-E factor negative regulatory protein RseB
VTRRVLLTAGAVVAVSAAACGVLAVLGTTSATSTEGDGWVGWTGRADTSAVSDKAAMTPDDASALRLLTRSAAAAASVAYAGRVVSWSRTETSTTDLLHVPGTGTVTSVVGVGSSKPTLAPEGRSGSFADDGRPLALLSTNYRVLREASLDTHIAGRAADAVVAIDASGVLAARYWVDETTGMLLRKELVTPTGTVWSRVGFTRFDLAPTTPSALPTRAPDAWSGALDATALGQARQRGCNCPDSLPGGLSLLDAREAPAGSVAPEPVVHQLFSDGLVSVSLFSLSGALSDADARGLAARGFVRREVGGWYAWVRGGTTRNPAVTVVWECRGEVLTLVSDDAWAPQHLVASVLAALPPDVVAPDDSLGARIARGWHRVTGGGS